MCDALCRTHRIIPDGTAVTGRYYGHAFTGVILSHRGGVHFCLPEYRVQVDRPFRFLGQGEPRTEVRIDITETARRGGRLTNISLEVIPPPPDPEAILPHPISLTLSNGDLRHHC